MARYGIGTGLGLEARVSLDYVSAALEAKQHAKYLRHGAIELPG